jgi:hypothetical protein
MPTPVPDKGRFLTFQGDETRKRGRLADKEDNTNEKWSFLQISILFVTELFLYGYPPFSTSPLVLLVSPS